MPTEFWKPVVGYEGHYAVSSFGRVQSLDRVLPHARYGERKTPGKLLDGSLNTEGRRQVKLADGSRPRRLFQVHRLVFEAFIGPIPRDLDVCHNNGDCLDNRPANLRVDTRSANMRDRATHGTLPWQDACQNGHPRDEHSQHYWRGNRVCGTCRTSKIARANNLRRKAAA